MVVPNGVCLIEQGQTDCNSRVGPIGELLRRLASCSTRTLLGGPAARPSSRRLASFVRRHRTPPFRIVGLARMQPGVVPILRCDIRWK